MDETTKRLLQKIKDAHDNEHFDADRCWKHIAHEALDWKGAGYPDTSRVASTTLTIFEHSSGPGRLHLRRVMEASYHGVNAAPLCGKTLFGWDTQMRVQSWGVPQDLHVHCDRCSALCGPEDIEAIGHVPPGVTFLSMSPDEAIIETLVQTHPSGSGNQDYIWFRKDLGADIDSPLPKGIEAMCPSSQLLRFYRERIRTFNESRAEQGFPLLPGAPGDALDLASARIPRRSPK